jgi:hypothetical protein
MSNICCNSNRYRKKPGPKRLFEDLHLLFGNPSLSSLLAQLCHDLRLSLEREFSSWLVLEHQNLPENSSQNPCRHYSQPQQFFRDADV